MTYNDCLQYRYSCRSLLYSLSYGEVWVMAARICMKLLCIKLSFIIQKQRQICDKLSFKLSFTALNPDSVGKFFGQNLWNLLESTLARVQYSTVLRAPCM